ncbi:hypothetical protein GCM10010946_34570 [Undibacterium squillarum]|uniref:Terminase small subunit n=2 Tax=Undibacterium squillarum TaxID=1131567 RepID=A0ABQ2Y2Y1_9BURK|nr:hypothetical protein GCM10010946_34570 [Undibacterium squillarum]
MSSEMSLRAYARHRGVALSAVQKAIRTNRIKMNRNGKIDAAIADRDWMNNTDVFKAPPGKSAPPAATDDDDLFSTGADPLATDTEDEQEESEDDKINRAQRQARLEIAQIRVEKERLELQIQKGQMIPLAEAGPLAFTAFRMVRDAILNVPGRVMDELAAETDPIKIENRLMAELTRVFGSIDIAAAMRGQLEDVNDGGN